LFCPLGDFADLSRFLSTWWAHSACCLKATPGDSFVSALNAKLQIEQRFTPPESINCAVDFFIAMKIILGAPRQPTYPYPLDNTGDGRAGNYYRRT
jgi:hypothetical protein